MDSPKCVVRVTVRKGSEESFGTGFFVRGGLFVTCRHVVQGFTDIRVRGAGTQELPCSVHASSNSGDDVVVLRPKLPLTDHSRGQLVEANLGGIEGRPTSDSAVYVYGASAWEEENGPRCVDCTLSQPIQERGMFGLNGNINPGDSGGPVVSSSGEVIAIAHGRHREITGYAAAIPIERVLTLLPPPPPPKRSPLVFGGVICGVVISLVVVGYFVFGRQHETQNSSPVAPTTSPADTGRPLPPTPPPEKNDMPSPEKKPIRLSLPSEVSGEAKNGESTVKGKITIRQEGDKTLIEIEVVTRRSGIRGTAFGSTQVLLLDGDGKRVEGKEATKTVGSNPLTGTEEKDDRQTLSISQEQEAKVSALAFRVVVDDRPSLDDLAGLVQRDISGQLKRMAAQEKKQFDKVTVVKFR